MMRERCCLLLVALSQFIVQSSQERPLVDVELPEKAASRGKMTKDADQDFSRNLRIIGGSYAGQTMPWVVMIDRAGYNSITCTGQVVESRWVVTAAHCLMNADLNGFVGPDGTRIVYNCSDTRSDNCAQANAAKVVVHPCYSPALDQNHDDIALIQLDRDLGIEPVLVDGWQVLADVSEGTEVALAGFGVLRSQDAEGSPRLMQVAVPLASKENCVAANPTYAREDSINFDHVLCTAHTGSACTSGSDAEGFSQSLVGVLSIGSELPLGDPTLRNCGVQGRYGVYTKIRWYTGWMVAVINEVYDTGGECPAVGIYNSTPESLSGLGLGVVQAWAVCSFILVLHIANWDAWR